MDGNGRWAQKRGHNRIFGHSRGVERAREITRECAKLGIEALTLYTFSTENWQRPPREVNFLMKLLHRYLVNETKELVENNIRFRMLGFEEMLPEKIQTEIKRVQKATEKNTGMIVNVALSYGSRQEIVWAIKNIVEKTKKGEIAEISEETVNQNLFTSGCPDPDLMIRTGGDQRISNFLLWQSAYAEFFFTPTCWPDFTGKELNEALATYQNRERRFGKVLNESRA